LQALLVDHAAALRAKSTPAMKIKDSLWIMLTGGEASDYTAAEPPDGSVIAAYRNF
jgi:hypothetical protein